MASPAAGTPGRGGMVKLTVAWTASILLRSGPGSTRLIFASAWPTVPPAPSAASSPRRRAAIRPRTTMAAYPR